MTFFQAILFAVCAVLVGIWFICIHRLDRLLRDRHPEVREELGLHRLQEQGLGKFRLARFLERREDLALGDAEVSRLTVFMYWLFWVYFVLFIVFMISLFRAEHREAAATVPADSHEATSPDRRTEAFALHKQKQYAKAIAAYDALLRSSDRDTELLYWRGMAHWQSGHDALALEDFVRVTELEPQNFEAHRDADRILTKQRRWDEILDLWNAYLRNAPNDAEALYERGGTHYRKGDIPAAHSDAARACELGKAAACSQAERLKPRL